MSARSRIVAAMAAVALTRTTSAQTLDRSRQPVAPPPKPFEFPVQHSSTLPNGLRLIVVENHALPLVVVRAVVGVDSLDDPVGKQGLYDLTAAMLREGTSSFSGDQIADSVAALGNDVTPFGFTTLTANVDRSLGVMAAMLAHPSFPATAFERAKATLTRAVQIQLQVPVTAPRRLLFEKLLGASHPIARSVVSPPAEIATITRDDVVRFYDDYFRPNNATLVVVGDVHTADVVAAARAAFADWTRGRVPRLELPAAPAPAPTTIYLIDRPNAPQTYTLVGALGPELSSRDYTALQVLAPILGATPASRLAQDLRERHSYYYSGTPFAIVWRPAPQPSMMYGSVPLYAAKTDSGLIAWLTTLRDARTQMPTPQEMALSQRFLVRALPIQIETNTGIANHLAFLAQNHLPATFDDAYIKSIERVTAADVLAAAKKHLDPDHLVIVMAGDRKLLQPRLEAAKIGPVVIVGEP